MSRPPAYFLGIDGGGTGTRARLTDADGLVLGNGSAGPATLRLGAHVSFEALRSAAEMAMAQAGLSDRAGDVHAGVGVAGFSFDAARQELKRILLAHGFASVTLEGDQHMACLGAHDGGDGGIVIVGTGSNAYGRIGARDVQIGGHGFPISDAGSGAWLGLEAVRVALHAHDGLVQPTPFTAELLKALGGTAFTAIAWGAKASATTYAALAPIVVAHAQSRDPIASAIMQRAGADVAGMIAGLRAQGIMRVALVGGLAQAIETFLPVQVQLDLSQPKGDAVDGGLLAARRLAAGAM